MFNVDGVLCFIKSFLRDIKLLRLGKYFEDYEDLF